MGVQDENRYNAGRGAHLTLKRAEKARALVNKLPGENCTMQIDSVFESNKFPVLQLCSYSQQWWTHWLQKLWRGRRIKALSSHMMA